MQCAKRTNKQPPVWNNNMRTAIKKKTRVYVCVFSIQMKAKNRLSEFELNSPRVDQYNDRNRNPSWKSTDNRRIIEAVTFEVTSRHYFSKKANEFDVYMGYSEILRLNDYYWNEMIVINGSWMDH